MCGIYLAVAVLFFFILTYEAIHDEELKLLARTPAMALLLALFIVFGAIGWLGLVMGDDKEDSL